MSPRQMKSSKHVLVIGGGLVGLCSAYSLLRAGCTVTIIDKNVLGAGAATGNAGEITPLQVAPLASPSMIKDIAAGVFTQNSYLSIAMSKLPYLAGFGLRFMRSARPQVMARSLTALAQFADGIFPSFDAMAKEGIDVSGGGAGYLFTSSNPEEIRAMHAGFVGRASLEQQNAPCKILRGDELQAVEPVLRSNALTGFLLPAERYLAPIRFVKSLIDEVRFAGATILESTHALKLDGASGRPGIRVAHANGTQEVLTADAVVLATGAWSKPLLNASGLRATMAAGKGYSFTVPVERMPRTLIHSVDKHFVATPMGGALRIAGIMEFDGTPDRMNPNRLEFLAKAASSVISGADWQNRTDEWVGPRPMTPDGLPMLGEVKGFPNTFVAAGHNMHGLSLGPVTGDIVTQMVLGLSPTVNGVEIDMSPFSPSRM